VKSPVDVGRAVFVCAIIHWVDAFRCFDHPSLFASRIEELMREWFSSRLSNQRVGVVAAVVYTLCLLSVAGYASFTLYDWARQRILDTSPMAALPSFASFVSTEPQPDASADASDPSEDGVADTLAEVVADASANESVPSQPINVLLLGTDARLDDPDPPRTDTMILLTIDPQRQSIGMLSLPRDLWVPIPGFGFESKINTAYTIGEARRYPGGGARLAMDTVSSFVGQPVHYYIRVNFAGFVELVDLIGGVDVMVPTTIHDEEFPTADYGIETFHLEAGAQHLDGETALKYVRTRNIDDDYGRAGRQQQVLRAVIDRVTRTDLVTTLLPRLPRLLYTMRSSIETDIPMAMQLDFANYLKTASLREVRPLVLDSRFGEETYSEEGAWILRPDRALVRAALDDFFSPAPAGDSVAIADPAWVRIEILNGTDQPGVAARTRDYLQRQGWQVVSIGDADRDDYARTIIVNYGVPDALVERVGVDLELQSNPSLHGLNASAPVDVRIVVGRDLLGHIP
jgi:LCP family protein required for cell wall assembly